MLTVTKLEQQKNDPRRINVYLDGEFAFGISREIAPWLEEGEKLSQQRIKELQTKDKVKAAYQRALHFLSYRIRSEKEIIQNLQKHNVSEEHIRLVLDKLRENSLVNDLDFAREWVENRSKFKPRGKKALLTELYHKGISRQIIDEVLEDINEEELAFRFARKKISRLNHLDKKSFQNKLYGYLSRRGFSYEISKRVIYKLGELQED
jgi:regulatory protein